MASRLHPADAERLHGRIGVRHEVLIERLVVWVRSTPCSAFSRDQVPPTPSRTCPPEEVHVPDALVSVRQGEGLFKVECVLHLAGRVVLGLEEGVEVPEPALPSP